VVADFRRRDMAAGGQGAPLVPAFHQALFRNLGRDRVIVNLGGIANITVLRGDPAAPVYGFDTGPASGLMDAWCQRERQQPFDQGGHWASTGTVNLRLLAALLSHPYFALKPPKSTGREDFHLAWLLSELEHFPGLPAEDVQATLLELTARSLTDAIKTQEVNGAEVILCGGGSFNDTLWQRLEQLLPGFRLQSSADYGLEPNWVEATAFAWLARQTLQGMPGNLPTVTGARGARILGSIHPA
jgi:anhydro-N-acetylmuramic acid kinase